LAQRKTTDFQTGFALHQMKSGPEYRSLVISRPDYSIVEFDAAGQEFKWMAIASGDHTMLELCKPGEDPHSFMGSRIDTKFEYRELIAKVAAEDKDAKRIRKGGKVANLALQYRTSAKTFCVRARVDHGMDMTLAEAEHGRFVYLRSYPGVPRYWTAQIADVKQRGYVETFAGRRVQVVGDWERYGWQMGSTAINYKIQGTGGDQKYLAIRALGNLYTEFDARLLIDLHDGLYSEVPDEHVTAFCVRGKQLLDNLPYTEAWGFTPSIPLPWDCKVGKSWGALKGVDL
jgi:DNA polymerase-1